MAKRYEKVHTVSDYWDGPRAGVADFGGTPHAYQSLFDDERDDYSDVWLLRPIDGDTFQLVMEDWDIWLRWLDAFHAGRTSQDTHPALPEDRPRHEQIKASLSDRIAIDPSFAVHATAEFSRDPDTKEWRVCWSALKGHTTSRLA
jgi:hypothetical protein